MRKGYTVTYQMRKQQRMRRNKIISYTMCVIIAILAAFLMIRFVCFSYTIQGDSMEPTYKSGEKRLINRFIFKVKSPSRYDIILFENNEYHQYYVKRVIGLPGETITMKDGSVYVDGKKTKTFSDEKIVSAGLASEGITLKENEYFVMGDNSNNSEDSRSATIGNVKRSEIIGKVGWKYWTSD